MSYFNLKFQGYLSRRLFVSFRFKSAKYLVASFSFKVSIYSVQTRRDKRVMTSGVYNFQHAGYMSPDSRGKELDDSELQFDCG